MLMFLAAALAAEKAAEQMERPAVREVSPGLFEVGKVRLSKEEQTVSFPASINMSSNLIEYACDGGDTRLHEALLRTDASPFDIHVAALLTCKEIPPTKTLLDESSVEGIPIGIKVEWEDGTEKRSVPLEKLVLKAGRDGNQREMDAGKWIYTSSRRHETNFMAQKTGLVIAIMEDRSALMNIRDPDRANDEIWFVNNKLCPPTNTAVRVVVQFGGK